MDKVEMADELAIARLTLEAVLTAWENFSEEDGEGLARAIVLVDEAVQTLDPARTTA